MCALLLSILFCSRDVVRMPISLRAVMPLANLLKSEDPSERYFAAQAICSLVTNGSRGTLLAVANAGEGVGAGNASVKAWLWVRRGYGRRMLEGRALGNGSVELLTWRNDCHRLTGGIIAL